MNTSGVRHQSRQGTVLIATLSVIVVLAGLSLVMMKSTEQNVNAYQQEKRQVQAEYVADSGISVGIDKLNNDLLPGNTDPGSLAGSIIVVHSGDNNNSPLTLRGTTEQGHPEKDRLDNDDDGNIDEDGEGNPLVDLATDDVTANGSYLGGLFRVKIQEWVGADELPTTTDGNGTPDILENGVDDDGDGTADNPEELFIGAKDLNDTGRDDDGDGDRTDNESGEVNFHTSKNTRYFTLAVEATYANYTVELRAFTNALEIAADKFGVYSSGTLNIRGSTTIDSYDSSEGLYGNGPIYSNGNVGSEESMSINANSVVKGDAKEWDGSTADGSPDVNGTVEGDATTLEETQSTDTWYLNQDFVDHSTGPDETASSDRTFTNASYRNLSIDPGVTVTLEAGGSHVLGNWNGAQSNTSPNKSASTGVYWGDSNSTLKIGEKNTDKATKVYIQDDFKPNGNLKIYGPPKKSDEPTEIYVADDFVARKYANVTTEGHVKFNVVDTMYFSPQGASITNTETNTSLLTFEVGGTWEGSGDTSSSNGEVNFQPTSDFRGFINAPEADSVNISPNGDFFGAVIGNNTTIQPGGNFHYDERISAICHEIASLNCNWVARSTNSWIISRRGASLTNP